MDKPIYSEFLSSNRENPIITYTWIPEIEPKGVVQLVHGMREHIGRYSDFAEFLNKHGFIVCGHDHIGHGKTALEYGSFGYFGEKYGAKVLVDDSAMFTRQLAERYPDLPLFLLGHSMGSFVTRLQVLSVSDLLSGYICMGTGGKSLDFICPYVRAFSGLISKMKGPKTINMSLVKASDKVFSRCLEKKEAPEAWISHDSETVRAYINDPLTNFYFTVQGYADLMDLQIASNRDEWYYRMDSLLPTFLVSGGDDPVSNMGEDLADIYNRLIDDSFMVDVSMKVYENMRHEILNEIDRQIVYDDLLDWINDHIIT